MKNSQNSQNEKTARKIILGALLIVTLFMFSSQSLALSFSSIQNYAVEETKTVEFNLSLADYNGTTSFSASPQGTINKVNDSLAAYSWTPSVGQAGNYTIIFTATDDLQTVSSQNKISVTHLNNPPVIISVIPGDQTVQQVTISLTTDRACTCKYSNSSQSYSQMPYTFAQLNTEKTEHQGKTPPLPQGFNTIYILCIDDAGNYMSSPTQVPLNINLKPTASISLDPSSPLREGIITVDVTTSEPLIGTPDLKYSFDDDSTLRTVVLTGSGTSWSGYIIIKNTDSERVGSFTFRGYDLTNLEGTDITTGKIFLVDTKIPSALQSLSIENLDDRVKISWEKPTSENVKEYKIYRKEGTGGVETVDYYDSTENLYFYDDSVEYNNAYYYAVSIVDDAGNEGPLSKEVFITHIPVLTTSSQQQTAPIVANKLDSKLEYILNEKLAAVEKTEMDISKADETLSRLLGTDNIDSITILGVLAKLSDNTNKITDLKNALENLRTQDLDEASFNSQVSNIMTQIDNIWKSTPLEVRVTDSSTYQEFTDDEKTTTVVSDYLGEYYKDISNKDITSSLDSAKKLQDLVIVNVKLLKGEIKYPEETKPFAIVKKTLTSSDVSGKTVLFESIPSSVAKPEDAVFSEQPFYKQNYVFWNLDGLTSKDISYVIYSDLNLADLKGVKSVVFIEQPLVDMLAAEQNKTNDTENSITGGVTGSTDKGGNNLLLVLIVAGVMIICGLFAYYVFWSEEEGKDKTGKDKTNSTKSDYEKIQNLENSEQSHKFSIAGALFKKKNESIIPDDSHRKLTIEKPAEEVNQRTDSYDFQRFRNMNNDTDVHNSDFNGKEKEENMPKSNSGNSSTNLNSTNHNLSELNEVQEKLQNLKEKSRIEDIEDFDELRAKTYYIKNLCEEIEEQSIIDFTNKTKANLEKSLLYIARYVPPTKSDGHAQRRREEVKEEKINETIVHLHEKVEEKSPSTSIINSNSNYPKLNNVAPEGKEFIFSDGSKAASIAELKEKLISMDDDAFAKHVSHGKNDFATWIGDIFLDYDLAHKVRFSDNKEDIIKLL